MNEDLLERSSQNIATLLQIFLLHEQNLARLSRQRARQENNPLGDLINIVLTSENIRNSRTNAQTNVQTNTPAEPEQRYSEHHYADIISPIYTECPITQETFEDRDIVVLVESCRHLFKRDPFHEWISISQTCPYCRRPL
jgi:hypothetical protein